MKPIFRTEILRSHVSFLVLLTMTSFVQASTACALPFPDIPSLTVSSKVIIDATAQEGGKVPILENTEAVLFKINSFLKGNITRTRNESLLAVSSDAGCLRDVEPNKRYIVFLTGAKQDFEFLVAKRLFQANGKPTLYDDDSRADVASFSCPTCGKKPKAKLKLTTSTINSGEKLEMKCHVAGSPPPTTTWFRGNIQMENNKDVTITDNGATSTLQIMTEDVYDYIDSYICRATNVLGEGESEKAYLVADSRDLKPSEVSYFTLCKDQNHCNGRGVCEEVVETGYKRCNCSSGYEGKRCQMSLVTEFPLMKGELSLWTYLSLFLFFFVLSVLIAILAILLKFKNDYNKDKRKQKDRQTEIQNRLNQLSGNEANLMSRNFKSFEETKQKKTKNLEANLLAINFKSSEETKQKKTRNSSQYSDRESLIFCTSNRRDTSSATPQELTPFDNEPRTLLAPPNNNSQNKDGDQYPNLTQDNSKRAGRVISSLPPQQKFYAVTFDDSNLASELLPPISPRSVNQGTTPNKNNLIRNNINLSLPIGRDDQLQRQSTAKPLEIGQSKPINDKQVDRINQYGAIIKKQTEMNNQSDSTGSRPVGLVDQSPISRENRLKEEADAIVNEMINYSNNTRASPQRGLVR